MMLFGLKTSEGAIGLMALVNQFFVIFEKFCQYFLSIFSAQFWMQIGFESLQIVAFLLDFKSCGSDFVKDYSYALNTY